MADVSRIPTEELLADLDTTKEDINFCQIALAQRITHHGSINVEMRLQGNKRILEEIIRELTNRGISV